MSELIEVVAEYRVTFPHTHADMGARHAFLRAGFGSGKMPQFVLRKTSPEATARHSYRTAR